MRSLLDVVLFAAGYIAATYSRPSIRMWVNGARAEIASGRHEEARTAYRRYLELAPRGWHKAEARAAVDAAGTTAQRSPAAKR